MTSMRAQATGLLTIHEPDKTPTRPAPLPWQEYQDKVMAKWFELLATDPEERSVQEFLELHPAMIPGGSGDVGPGGHHGSEMGLVFREPELKGIGRDYGPDFMWITRSSGLVTPVLIEIEKPSKRWFNKNGRPSADLTAALDQLNDWRSWFNRDGNTAAFRERYLFKDSYDNRPLEPQYLLIYGRESEFEHGGGHSNPDGVRSKREGLRHPQENFRTFDSLRPRFDHGDSITVTMTAEGPRPFAFSPVYGTSAGRTGFTAELLGDPSAALGRSKMMTEERKAYIAGRWEHWRAAAKLDRDAKRSAGFQSGLE